MTPLIREARMSDQAALADLTTQLGYPADVQEVGERLRRLQEGTEGQVLVAQAAGALVGWIHVAPVLCLEAEPWAEIRGLVVDSTHRGRGVGTALVQAAEDWARRAGFPLLRLRMNVVRAQTHEFYLRRGFRQLKTQHVFVKDVT